MFSHFRFTGKERDAESGLDYFGARYYSSAMGRFMSPDWEEIRQVADTKFFFSCLFLFVAAMQLWKASFGWYSFSFARVVELVRKPYIRLDVRHEHSWIGRRMHHETYTSWSEVSPSDLALAEQAIARHAIGELSGSDDDRAGGDLQCEQPDHERRSTV
ncbi:MAG: RHS repeat-associated core domain-containing protein [Acidobacteriaceae bacterium]